MNSTEKMLMTRWPGCFTAGWIGLREDAELAPEPTPEQLALRERNRVNQQAHRAKPAKLGRPRLPGEELLANFHANRERQRLARQERNRHSRIANGLPRVETKQPQTWNTAKLHEEVATEFRAREQGEAV